MGITYKIDTEAGLCLFVAEGEIGAADILAVQTRFADDPLFTPNLAVLFDGRLAKFSFGGEETRKIAYRGIHNRPTQKTAILIDEKAQGWARMYQAWRDDLTNIFHDMASAREWLGLPPEEE